MPTFEGHCTSTSAIDILKLVLWPKNINLTKLKISWHYFKLVDEVTRDRKCECDKQRKIWGRTVFNMNIKITMQYIKVKIMTLKFLTLGRLNFVPRIFCQSGATP